MTVLHTKFVAVSLTLYSLLSVLLTYRLVVTVWSRRPIPRHPYVTTADGALPTILPGGHSDPVQMVLEDTVHYRHPNSDVPKEWFYANPQGAGSYRAAGHVTIFLTMLHQHHCIETFGEQLTRTNKKKDWGHLQHCMNYIREMAMCRPDLTLEPGDFTKRDFTTERTGAVHVCRKLSTVYDAMDKNWMEWAEVRKERLEKGPAATKSLDGGYMHDHHHS